MGFHLLLLVFEFLVLEVVLWSLQMLDQEMEGRHPQQDLCPEEVVSLPSCDGSKKLRIGSVSDLEKDQRLLQFLKELNCHNIKDCRERQR